MDLSAYTTSARRKVIVYGPPKTGKTALVGKLASHFKLHWVDLENGIKTLLNPAILDPKYRSNVNVINVPDHQGYPIAVQTVTAILKGNPVTVCFDHGKANCPICSKLPDARTSKVALKEFTDKDILVIDSGSQLAASALNHVTRLERQKPGGEEYKCTFHDYASQGALLDQILSLVQVIDANIIVISHDTDTETTEGKERIVPSMGTRNFSRNVAKYFDTVVALSVLNKKHSAMSMSVSSPTHLTGDRYGVSLDSLKDDALTLLPVFGIKP